MFIAINHLDFEVIFITGFLKKDTDSEGHTYSPQKSSRGSNTNPKTKPDVTGRWDQESSDTGLRGALILIH